MVDKAYEAIWGNKPKVTVDALVINVDQILLIKRKDGTFALPGGFLNPGERLLAGAVRELQEETNLDVTKIANYLIDDFYDDNPRRDPRTHIITHVFVFHSTDDKQNWHKVEGRDDAIQAFWISASDAAKFPSHFWYADHDQLINQAMMNILLKG